jgi:hypothetical protein
MTLPAFALQTITDLSWAWQTAQAPSKSVAAHSARNHLMIGVLLIRAPRRERVGSSQAGRIPSGTLVPESAGAARPT